MKKIKRITIMETLCILSEVKQVRTFNGARGEVKVAEVNLKSGADVIQASAFEELATKFENGTLKKGVLYKVDLFFSIQKGEKGEFQKCTINKIDVIYDVSAF